MADEYSVIALIAIDTDFRNRITAAVVKEKIAHDPEKWVWDRRWEIAALPSWAEKVGYWMSANSATTGWQNDQTVISDNDILSGIENIRTTLLQ